MAFSAGIHYVPVGLSHHPSAGLLLYHWELYDHFPPRWCSFLLPTAAPRPPLPSEFKLSPSSWAQALFFAAQNYLAYLENSEALRLTVASYVHISPPRGLLTLLPLTQ